MFSKKVGGLDRNARIVVGLPQQAGFMLNADAEHRWLYLIGIIPLATGLMSSCPLYSIFGLNTCPRK
jgi:hypothetical protein